MRPVIDGPVLIRTFQILRLSVVIAVGITDSGSCARLRVRWRRGRTGGNIFRLSIPLWDSR